MINSRNYSYCLDFPDFFFKEVVVFLQNAEPAIKNIYLVGSLLSPNKARKYASDIDILITLDSSDINIKSLQKQLSNDLYTLKLHKGRSVDFHFREEIPFDDSLLFWQMPMYNLITKECINFTANETISEEIFETAYSLIDEHLK